MKIDGTLTQHDDGYRFWDWFRAGTREAAEAAATADDADRIMRDGYLGPDCDGVEAVWTVA